MWNAAVSTVKRLRIGLLFKMWLLCLAVTFLYDMYFVYYALPGFQNRVFDYKREEVQCGTDVAIGVLNSYRSLEAEGILTTGEAQSRALADLDGLRYGDDNEGTFWVSDYQPVLLADQKAEVRAVGPRRAMLDDAVVRGERNPLLRIVEKPEVDTGLGQHLLGICAQASQERGNDQRGAHAHRRPGASGLGG